MILFGSTTIVLQVFNTCFDQILIETQYLNSNYWSYSMYNNQVRFAYFKTLSNLINSDKIYKILVINNVPAHKFNKLNKLIFNKIIPDTQYVVTLDNQMKEFGSSKLQQQFK